MSNSKKIQSALISVYYKDNLEPIIKKLHSFGVKLYSTGGTLSFIEKLNIPVTAVDSVTSYPEIFGGRVKTLHPAIFGGILNRRDNESDVKEKAIHKIPDIDLVIVDLYPFEETLASGAKPQDIIEKIDIGGISLIRAAAKNFNDVVIVSSRNDYSELLSLLESKNGSTDLDDRRKFAAKAFATSSHYDSAIFNYFNQEENIPQFKHSIQQAQTLRYGENPHQQGIFYGDLNKMFTKLAGKELSYNNLLDVDAGVALIGDFSEPTFAILKHNNACGVASRNTITSSTSSTPSQLQELQQMNSSRLSPASSRNSTSSPPSNKINSSIELNSTNDHSSHSSSDDSDDEHIDVVKSAFMPILRPSISATMTTTTTPDSTVKEQSPPREIPQKIRHELKAPSSKKLNLHEKAPECPRSPETKIKSPTITQKTVWRPY